MPRERPKPRKDIEQKKETTSKRTLEAQLFQVIEREGVTVSKAEPKRKLQISRTKFQTRKGADGSDSSHVTNKTNAPGTERTPEAPDTVRALDARLTDRVRVSSASKIAKPIAIRHAEHRPSEHVVTMYATARKMEEERMDPFGATVQAWMAPYETPPSLEGMAAEANDLCVDEVDPRLFVDQFTPGDADVAYAERYRWWSKVRAPFVRWEVAGWRRTEHGTRNTEQQTEETDGRSDLPLIRGIEGVSEPELVAMETVSDQFTSPDADVAYKSSYSLGSRVSSFFSRLRRTSRKIVEEVKEEEQDMIAQVEQSWGVPVLVPKLDYARVMAGFFGLLLFVTIPAGAVELSRSFGSSVKEVTSSSRAALIDIRVALHGTGAEQADAWGAASKRFQAADASLSQANVVALALAQAIPATRSLYQSTRALLSAGDKAAQAGKLLSRGYGRALGEATLHPDERLMIFSTYVEQASPLLEDAMRSVASVKTDSLPDSVRPQVEELKTSLADGQSTLRDLHTLTDFMLAALGHDRARTYLFVFQNTTELRPTGGFMGSLAEITMDRGEFKHIFVPGGGPYDLKSQLKVRVVPPKPLQLVASRWEFQDANWFPDFPTAADKIRWFWSNGGQPSLDGIVAINSTIMEKLLTVTGPIDMPEYGKTITADNFRIETQKAVELEYDKTANTPKKFVGDLMQKLMERVKGGSRDGWIRYLSVMVDALDTKDIQVAMFNADEKGLVEKYGWSGRIKPVAGDALAIIEANIAGQKSDASIEEHVTHEASVASDGSITDTVTLQRTHTGQKGELFSGVNNVEYVRVYVPLGSELLAASGFQTPSSTLFKTPLPEDPEDADVARLSKAVSSTVVDVDVTEEFGRTAFGGWMQLKPGETSVTTFRYRLPFTAFDIARNVSEVSNPSTDPRAAYLLLLTSQSGTANRTIDSSVAVPSNWKKTWSNVRSASNLTLSATWDRDRAMAGLFDPIHATAENASRESLPAR